LNFLNTSLSFFFLFEKMFIGDIQGSSLTVVFEGTIMSREEVCSLQLPPPWKLRGNILNYGLGLLSGYFVCDTLTILSGGYFYIFDPLGLTGGASSTATSSARFFSLIGEVWPHICLYRQHQNVFCFSHFTWSIDFL
jgi:hypothetical protein